MKLYDALPWSELAAHLRESARKSSGIEGALVGAAFGAAATIATMPDHSIEKHLKPILTGAVLGLIFGATQPGSVPNIHRP